MATPDQTEAFEADIKSDPTQGKNEADELRARLREIERVDDVILDEEGNEVGAEVEEIVAPNKAEVKGTEFRFYAPKETALLAFGLGTSNKRKGQLVMATMQRFIGFHLDEESYSLFMDRMSDPHDEWADDDFGELVNHIVESADRAPQNGPTGRK